MMRGEILFQTLSHFQRFENDVARGDEGEGRSSDPARGQNLTQGRPFDLPESKLVSRVQALDIFVCCLSQRQGSDLAKKFGASCIVVIKDPKRFLERIKRALPPWAELPEWEGMRDDGWRIAKPVTYDTSGRGVVHAFPAEIATRKDLGYSRQQEYRILFGRKHALRVGNVTYSIEPEGYGQLAEQEEQIVVQTSTLQDIAEIVSVSHFKVT